MLQSYEPWRSNHPSLIGKEKIAAETFAGIEPGSRAREARCIREPGYV